MANQRKKASKKNNDEASSRLAATKLASRTGNSARNRRVPQSKYTRKQIHGQAQSRDPQGRHEAVSVALGCAGSVTLLALVTYSPMDVSLNTSGTPQVANWVGPAGAYWADLLLQILGVGAFALGAGLLLAAWRAMMGCRVLPGIRESLGTLFLVVCVGAFAHILLRHDPHPYPAGGILGAIIGQWLLRQFALVGGYMIAGAAVLMSIAITADGVLLGLGHRGIGALLHMRHLLHLVWTIWTERRQQIAITRAKQQDALNADLETPWALKSVGQELPVQSEPDALLVAQAEDLENARARGRILGDRAIEKDRKKMQRRALRDQKEPAVGDVDAPVDLAHEAAFEEAAFELGDLPVFAPTPVPRTPTPGPKVAKVCTAKPQQQSDIEPLPMPNAEEKTPGQVIATKPKSVLLKESSMQPDIVDMRPEVDLDAIEDAATLGLRNVVDQAYELPSPGLLEIEETNRTPIDRNALRESAKRLIKTLKDYGIEGRVREIRPGPVITMFEFVPAPGIKISKIANLADDLAMSMEALRVRIVAPIPGKGAVGIEIPNKQVETVFLKELLTHKNYKSAKASLPIALGKDTEGRPYITDLAKMPHLLVAGATGAGKSVSVNTMIMSILFNATPKEVRLIMVDPKMLELSVYDGIPHLLLPVVTDPKKAAVAMRWAVAEMERRYKVLSGTGVRNIDSYNSKVAAASTSGKPLTCVIKDKLGNDETMVCEHMPYIVIIVDELADLMMVAPREVEASIMRLAQMARAAGIHLVLATQRPSVDVLTGVIKANFPTRIAFQVASRHDSRTILDGNGAEHLLGKGDMLFMAPGSGGVSRIHGSWVQDEEIERTVAFVKQQGESQYDESILANAEDADEHVVDEGPVDEMYDQAVAIVAEARQASISMIQRRLRIGYNRAARLVETMEKEGIVGPPDGAKPREVLVQPTSI